MRVSLIIPNYNNARFLGQCLESALSQTMPFEQIVVVDDASTDDSVRIVEAVRSRAAQVELIALSRRLGVAAARDRGIQAVSAPFITTLDADDFLLSERKNEREIGVLSAASRPEATVAFSDVRRISVAGEDMGAVSSVRPVREGWLFEALLNLECFVPRDFTFSRAAYDEVGGYDPSFAMYEDWDLKLRLARICEFRYTGAVGVAYRINPEGLSHLPVDRHLTAMWRVVCKNTRHAKRRRG